MQDALQSAKNRSTTLNLPSGLGRALVLSQVFAVGWWLVALWLRGFEIIPVWYDQQTEFGLLIHHLDNPYAVPRFVNAPWTAILVGPFGLLPVEWSVLAQVCLYFAILTGVIWKFGGNLRAVLITLTSFFAFVSTVELNVDWPVALGLLVPVQWSGPLLLVKPQVALGYYFGYRPNTWLRVALFTLVVAGIGFLLWGLWPVIWLESVRASSLTQVIYNLAPSNLMPVPISWAIGLGLAYYAYKRQDSVIGIFAWIFLVPYTNLYSLTSAFALAAARWPRVALVISGAMWLVYGGVLAVGLLKP